MNKEEDFERNVNFDSKSHYADLDRAIKETAEHSSSSDHIWQEGCGRNLIALQQVRIQIDAVAQSFASSKIQKQQTEAMIFWTKIMVFAIISQVFMGVIVGSFQAWIYYQQLNIMRG
jgi:hypothetical protein